MGASQIANAAQCKLIEEIGRKTPGVDERTLAAVLEADGRRDMCAFYHIDPLDPDDPLVARARVILAELRAAP